jgi:hypothetical protein
MHKGTSSGRREAMVGRAEKRGLRGSGLRRTTRARSDGAGRSWHALCRRARRRAVIVHPTGHDGPNLTCSTMGKRAAKLAAHVAHHCLFFRTEDPLQWAGRTRRGSCDDHHRPKIPHTESSDADVVARVGYWRVLPPDAHQTCTCWSRWQRAGSAGRLEHRQQCERTPKEGRPGRTRCQQPARI